MLRAPGLFFLPISAKIAPTVSCANFVSKFSSIKDTGKIAQENSINCVITAKHKLAQTCSKI